MSSSNMSIQELEQRHVDLNKVPPLEPNRLVGFVNHFAINIVKQLNNLLEVADKKLYEIHCKVAICKTNLLILERKLNSVPGLANLEVPARKEPLQQPDEPQPSSSNDDKLTADTSNPVTSKEESPQESVPPTSDIPENPELEKYYKMLKVGVPLPAVRIKMSAEGFDPDLLKV